MVPPDGGSPRQNESLNLSMTAGQLCGFVEYGTWAYDMARPWGANDVRMAIAKAFFKYRPNPGHISTEPLADNEGPSGQLVLDYSDVMPRELFARLLPDMAVFHQYTSAVRLMLPLKPYVEAYLASHRFEGREQSIYSAPYYIPVLLYLLDGHDATNDDYARLRKYLDSVLPSPLVPPGLVPPLPRTSRAYKTAAASAAAAAVLATTAYLAYRTHKKQRPTLDRGRHAAKPRLRGP